MRQHPIPQDITNYKFHLIGSMTLKQFGELAAGVIIALIIYSTNLIGIVKWGLILFVVGLAALVAFVPIEERPLDHWIITFFKNLWKPTKFFWKRKTEIPDFMNYKIHQINQEFNSPEVDFNPARKKRIHEYLSSIPKNGEQLDDWDKAENQRIGQLINTFSEVKVDESEVEITPDKKEKPNLKTRVRNLKAPSRLKTEKQEVEIVNENPKTEDLTATDSDLSQATVAQTQNLFNSDEENQSQTEELTLNPQEIQETVIENQTLNPENSLQEEINNEPETVIEPEPTNEENNSNQIEENSSELIESKINNDLPMPTRPDVPNKLAGMVLNQAGEIIPNALIEIKNDKGQSSRIVKSNQFGQFFIRTPLENGKYQMFIETSDYQFQPFDLKLKGKIVPPIEIRALS